MSLATVQVVASPPEQPSDWRLVRMRSLVEDQWLPGEWDPVRLLLVPRPDGLLCRRRGCLVPGCPHYRHGKQPLCQSHTGQFARSGAAGIEAWVAADGPGATRRRLSDDGCAVRDGSGACCPRPARGPRGLCLSHDETWSQRSHGLGFEEFLAKAQPLPSFGDCTAASCFRVAAHGLGLCEAHYRIWIKDGSPRGAALERWCATVRQPATRLVLSLRGLPELVRLEVLYAIQRRVAEQIRTAPENMAGFVGALRASGVASVLGFDPRVLDPGRNAEHGRFARYVLDQVALAYRDPEAELAEDCWDLRVFGRRGQLDFSPVRQGWLRTGAKRWAAATMGRVADCPTLQARVRAVGVLSAVLASGPGGGLDPAALGRADVDRFLVRLRTLRSPSTGEQVTLHWASSVAKAAGLVVREATEMGFLPGLGPTFAFRRGDAHWPIAEEEEGRALPAHVVAQLDAHLDLLAAVPGPANGPQRCLGVLGDRAGAVAVLAYRLLEGTGRRVGEVASLHLDCLDVDEDAKAVLIYDNHKAARMRRRLPVADTALVEAVREQQHWVTERFPGAPRERLWLLPRPNKNRDGSAHISSSQLYNWLRAWVDAIPVITAGPADEHGEPLSFPRSAITPHAFRHTYAQVLADQGVPAPVLRDLMDHQHMGTTLGYYRVGERKKREAMELLARHTVDNRGTARPTLGPPSRTSQLREQLSWVAVPMGKCSEPANVRAGGQACPIRYQCAGCPHFESDPSYLPELRAYADDLRREREASFAMGAADWVVANIERQLGVIVEHVRAHEQLLAMLPAEDRAVIEEASLTVRKARQSVPVAFGRRAAEQRQ